MATRLQELCALIVEDTCGSVCSQIFTTIASHGRLSRNGIHNALQIPTTLLYTALAVLVQQHIVLHHTVDEGITFYQPDWRNTYYLLRSSRLIALTRERHGECAGKIVATLLQLGHARVGDLAHAVDLESASKHDSGTEAVLANVNGNAAANGSGVTQTPTPHGDTNATVAQFHKILRSMLNAGFLVKLGERSYLPSADLQHELEEIVIQEHFPDGKITGPKKQVEFKSAVNNLKRKWRDAEEFCDQDLDLKGVARGLASKSAKRVKLNGDLTNGADDDLADEDVPKLPNEMVLRVNHAQAALAFRSSRLEQFAQLYLGGVTATVYGALLQVLEGKLRARDSDLKIDENEVEASEESEESENEGEREDDGGDDEDDDDEDEEENEEESPIATTMDVADMLDPDLDLTLGLHGASDITKLSNGDNNVKKKSKHEFSDIGIKEESDSDNDDPTLNGYSSYGPRAKRLSLIEDHLRLLAEHPKTFCKRVGIGGRGEWRVNFSALTKTLIYADIDSTVFIRFGKIHMRMVRLLRERGRLDEKQVANFAMMRLKDVRAILTELQYSGIIESQEVPKDAARQPGKTMYLWFHDQRRVQSLILQQTYQGISRIFQRLKHERENYKTAISKADSMDVNPTALNRNERDAVMHWREVEEKLLVQLQRMEEMVALFRDFSGKDTSLVS